MTTAIESAADAVRRYEFEVEQLDDRCRELRTALDAVREPADRRLLRRMIAARRRILLGGDPRYHALKSACYDEQTDMSFIPSAVRRD